VSPCYRRGKQIWLGTRSEAGAEDDKSGTMRELKLVVAVIANVLGLVLLALAHDPALAAVLFVIGAILSLYSLLDWLTARRNKPSL
jgi:hypothetical protein